MYRDCFRAITRGFHPGTGGVRTSGDTPFLGGTEPFEQAVGDVPVLLTEWGPHLAALLGIVALALLGGGLVIRNRFVDGTTTERDESSIGNDEFMTDRERIHHLVSTNGGRMKQSEIVDAVDWSKAKVSRLLADLEDEDEITKLRLGRENLICLRGQEPAASQSSDGSGSE